MASPLARAAAAAFVLAGAILQELGAATAAHCYLSSSGPGTDAPPCDLIDRFPQYLDGRWVKDDSCKLGDGEDPYEWAGYQPQVTGPAAAKVSFNPLWDVGLKGRACFGLEAATNKAMYNIKARSLAYRWQPRHCTLPAFRAARMRSLLAENKMRVVFVGDSMMNQLVSSLWALTGEKPRFSRSWILVNHKTLAPMLPADVARCSGSNPPAHVCPDLPRDGEDQDDAYHREISALGWTAMLPHTDVLVLNTGAHLARVIDLNTPDQLRKVAQATARYLAVHLPKDTLLVWMTTPAFADGCGGATDPVPPPFSWQKVTEKYHWRQLSRLEREGAEQSAGERTEPGLWQAAFGKEPALKGRVVILNTTMSELRADQHPPIKGDCFHYCYPGQPDLWAQLLQRILDQHQQRLNAGTSNEPAAPNSAAAPVLNAELVSLKTKTATV